MRASQDSPALPEATPNPSLPEHMKLKAEKGKKIGTRVPLQHR
jgi:hypothetical protein